VCEINTVYKAMYTKIVWWYVILRLIFSLPCSITHYPLVLTPLSIVVADLLLYNTYFCKLWQVDKDKNKLCFSVQNLFECTTDLAKCTEEN